MKVMGKMLRSALIALLLLGLAGCAAPPARSPEARVAGEAPDNQGTTDKAAAMGDQTAETVDAGRDPLAPVAQKEIGEAQHLIHAFCQQVGSKLGSVSPQDCERQGFTPSATTVMKHSLVFKDYGPMAQRSPLGRVLLIGGIHGDEFSSMSVVFKWMDILNEHHSGLFQWRFIPIANPDGLLRKNSQRQNQNGVDLNRNFPTADWDQNAYQHWIDSTYRNTRRFPGETGASEIETQWLVEQIREFKPDVIISVHAPHHLLDYDGPPQAPQQLGKLNLQPLGVFPGSLGNYAGHDLQLPVVTVELQAAGSMPSREEIDRMWSDLVKWLRLQLKDATPQANAEQAG